MLVEMLIIEDVFRIEPPKQKLQLLLRWFCSLITKVKVVLAEVELSDMCDVSKQFLFRNWTKVCTFTLTCIMDLRKALEMRQHNSTIVDNDKN